MITPPVSCPYCNSNIVLSEPAVPGQRIRCPRCHELLPALNQEAYGASRFTTASGEPAVQAWQSEQVATETYRFQWANRAVASTIVSIMLVMAAIGLAFAWHTIDKRRQRDHPDSAAPAGLERVVSVRPDRLAALAYMPPKVSVLAGIHVAELMGQDSSRELLSEFRANPGSMIADLEQRTGVKLENIDHIVVGLGAEASIFPPVICVVRTRDPYGARGLRESLKARASEEPRGRTMYHFQVGDFLWYLWCPDDRTIVTSLRSKDMPTEPFAPAAGESYAAHFEPTVRKCLQDDMTEGTQAWIVGSTETLDATFSAMPFLQIPSELRKSLKDVQAFAGWMQLDGKAAWHVTIDCAGLEATDSLSGYLNRLGLERGKDLHLFGNRATTARLASQLSHSLARKREGTRIVLTAESSLESIWEALSNQPR